MKRFLALALSMLMILGVLLAAGCDDGTGIPTDNTTKAPQNSQSTSSSNADSTGSSESSGNGADLDVFDPTKKMPGYEDVDFGGKVFVIVGDDGADDGCNTAKEIYIQKDNDSPDAIDLAIDQRNKLIEQLYNCVIQGEATETPGGDASNNVLKGGNEISIFNDKYGAATFATSGKVYNLLELGSRTIDFSQSYFDQAYVNMFTIKDNNGNNKLYGIIGDFARTAFDCTHALVYNKTVYANTEAIRDIDIYQLVRDKKWTLDTFMMMAREAAVDNKNPGTYKEEDGDIVGWIRTQHAPHGLHVASGLEIISNVNGKYVFNVQADVAAWSSVLDKACAAYADPVGQETSYGNIPAAVAGGRALFCSEIIASSLGNLKDLDCEIGLLPYPVYNEGDDYHHYVDNHLAPYAVPLHVDDIANVGDFLVLYAYYSKHIVRPAYINVFAYEYCSDEDSYEMLNIILDSRTYDIGYLGPNYEGEITGFIKNNKPQTISNYAGSKAKVAQIWIDSYMTKITANQS